MGLLIRWFITSVAVLAAAYLLPGVRVAGFTTALLVALVVGLLNVFLKPILLLLTLPLNFLTLGLFTFVINAVIILIASSLVKGFLVNGFWWALLFSILLSVITTILSRLFA